jgi:LPXTG-motif cell wall-anchored protein
MENSVYRSESISALFAPQVESQANTTAPAAATVTGTTSGTTAGTLPNTGMEDESAIAEMGLGMAGGLLALAALKKKKNKKDKKSN